MHARDAAILRSLGFPRRPRITPSRPPRDPAIGERRPKPYSTDNLDALLATVTALRPMCMVSLQCPSSHRIVTEQELCSFLASAKNLLSNLRRRHGLPASILVTEFDPVEVHGILRQFANFHILFEKELRREQQEKIRQWFLKRMGLASNQGGAFHYSAKGGGVKLVRYGSKDRKRAKHGKCWTYVKSRPEWLPVRLSYQLWFCIGIKRRPACEGAAIRKQEGWRRRKPDSAHGITSITSDVCSMLPANAPKIYWLAYAPVPYPARGNPADALQPVA